MYDNDQLTDSPELRELRDALSGVGMPGQPPLEIITSRGQAHRRQRRARATRFSVGGVVVAGALAVGVSLAATPAQKLGTIQRAAYTLHHNQNGTDTLTLNPVELLNPSQLQSDLAQYGIPAKVATGSYCTTTPEPTGFSQAVTLPGPGGSGRVGSSDQPTITIDPVAVSVGHRAQRRLLPAHIGPRCRRAAGQHVPHQHQRLQVHQHPARHVPAGYKQPGLRPDLRRRSRRGPLRAAVVAISLGVVATTPLQPGGAHGRRGARSADAQR